MRGGKCTSLPSIKFVGQVRRILPVTYQTGSYVTMRSREDTFTEQLRTSSGREERQEIEKLTWSLMPNQKPDQFQFRKTWTDYCKRSKLRGLHTHETRTRKRECRSGPTAYELGYLDRISLHLKPTRGSRPDSDLERQKHKETENGRPSPRAGDSRDQ